MLGVVPSLRRLSFEKQRGILGMCAMGPCSTNLPRAAIARFGNIVGSGGVNTEGSIVKPRDDHLGTSGVIANHGLPPVNAEITVDTGAKVFRQAGAAPDSVGAQRRLFAWGQKSLQLQQKHRFQLPWTPTATKKDRVWFTLRAKFAKFAAAKERAKPQNKQIHRGLRLPPSRVRHENRGIAQSPTGLGSIRKK